MDDLTRKKLDSFSNTISLLDKGYTLKKLPDGKVWVVENLREKVERAFWKADNGSLNYQGSFSCWWSSTWSSTKRAGYLSFNLSRVNLQENCNKRVGCAVRLIKN